MNLQHLHGWCHVKLLHAVFLCVQTMVWLPVPVFVIFNVCPDVMHLIAHRGLSGHHKSLHWKSTGRKTHCCTRGSNPRQYCPGFSARQSTNWAISITAPAWPGVSLSLSVSVRTITQQSVWDSHDEQKKTMTQLFSYIVLQFYTVCVWVCVYVWNALLADCSNV